MKDYIFLIIIVALIAFIAIKEIRNDSVERNLKKANKEIQVKYDSLQVKIIDLQYLIIKLDSAKVINNNYYTEVINESDSIIKADSNAVNGLIRKQLNTLAGSN